MRTALLLVALVALIAPASAGSRDAPEVTDATGDCAFAAGNEYADIVAAWVSAETAQDFSIDLQLAKFTEQAAAFAGYTLQFTHQDVQFGVVAFFDPANGGWEFSTGYIDMTSGEMRDFDDTSGAFDASSATLTILFPKSLFPHDGDDNTLRGFVGGTADLKKDVPVFVAQGAGAPVPTAGPLLICDQVESSAVYTFTTGQHTQHAGAATPTTPSAGEDPSETAAGAPEPASPTPTPSSPARGTPGVPLAALLLGVAGLALARRVSRE